MTQNKMAGQILQDIKMGRTFWQETEKSDCGTKDETGDFSSTDPYKTERMLGAEEEK
jgi:hypothetical protein